jgi:flavin reductase (DIM6/NTAB) family NADH-FMN oxidoreductase RutF
VSDRSGKSASGPLVSAVDYPLYVVTACAGAGAGGRGADGGADSSGSGGRGADGAVSGCLAGFVTQSSIKPVQFLICISKLNHTFSIAESSRGLGLHVLGSDQRDAASHFGELTGDEVDKFEGIAWAPGRTGAPILAECAAWIEGLTIGRMDAGDHEVFLISVEAGGVGRHTGCFTLRDASGFEAGHPE